VPTWQYAVDRPTPEKLVFPLRTLRRPASTGHAPSHWPWRRVLLARLGMSAIDPDLIMDSPMDTLAGSIVLFRGGASPRILERIDYGAVRAVLAPPPGTSMLRVTTTWAIDPTPTVQPLSSGAFPGPGFEGCLDAPIWGISGLMTRCDDGSTVGQYIHL